MVLSMVLRTVATNIIGLLMKPYIRSGRDDWYGFSESLSCSSVSSPRHNGRLLLRANPFTYLKQRSDISHFGPSIGENRGPYYLGNFYLTYGQEFSESTLDPNGIIAFYNAIGEKAVNLLDLIRTRQQTVDMVTSNVMKLVRSLRHLKKGRWKKAASALGVTAKKQPSTLNVPRRWLELQYGWLPILNDVYKLCTSLFRDPIVSVRKTRTYNDKLRSYNRSWTYGVSSYSLIATMSTTLRRTWFTELQIDSDTITTADNLGLLNPSLVAWEAVPYSFVVDWFYPVGDWLASLTALKGVKLLNSSVTDKAVWSLSGLTTRKTKPSGSKQFSFKGIYKKRVLGIPARPLPAFKNPLSLTHFANAMSLLANIFSKK